MARTGGADTMAGKASAERDYIHEKSGA